MNTKERAMPLPYKRQSYWRLLTETFTQWSEDKPFQLAAALAYYTLFSLAPLLLIAITITGVVFGREATEQQIVNTLGGLVGPQGAQAIRELLRSASHPQAGVLGTLISILTLLIGAGGVVGQLQDSLNTIWGVAPKPGRGLWGLLKDRFVSLSLVLGVGFLLLVSLLVSTVLSAAITFMSGALPGGEGLWHAVELGVSFGFTTLLFALIYKLLPAVEIAWRDVWVGAAMTAVLFTLGKFLIGLYLGQSGIDSAYGAASSLVLVLVWVYYAGLIFFFGAEFTQVYANTYGTGVTPGKEAMVSEDKTTRAKHAVHEEHLPRSERPREGANSGG
jgi:membrane protein